MLNVSTYSLVDSFNSYLRLFLKNLLLLRLTHRAGVFHSDLSANHLQRCNETAPSSPSALFNTSQETLAFWQISVVTTICCLKSVLEKKRDYELFVI